MLSNTKSAGLVPEHQRLPGQEGSSASEIRPLKHLHPSSPHDYRIHIGREWSSNVACLIVHTDKKRAYNSIDIDSDSFEVFEIPELQTPTPIEIANSNETGRMPTTHHAGIIQGTTTLKPLEADNQTPLKLYGNEVHEHIVGNSSAYPEVPFSTAEDRTMKSRGGGSPPRSFEIPPDDTTEVAGSGDYLPRLSPETMDRIVQMGRNSPGSKPEALSSGPPVSYIPADHPGGPRDLPSGWYRCPVIDCQLPFGPANEGYDRGGLARHIDLSHRGPDEMWDARDQIRQRVMDLRFEQGRGLSRTLNSGSVAHGFYQEIDELVSFLDEIRELEDSRRFVVPQVVQFSSVRNAVLKG
ncbi:hypothetical protein VM1G_04412 [Cytospora mali]|uniref:Uncharacterized protein n=1 Tax=Cytospora mali TaxID=578113 RepID=A0A194VWD9_CYTMA|nr:hypothetical protein VM1G_04412 [Valsa mali]